MSKSLFRKKTIERILADVASGFGDGEHSDPHLKKRTSCKRPNPDGYSGSCRRRYIFNYW